MDFSTVIEQLNWLAVTCAALATFLIGGIWYSPFLFQKPWMDINGFSIEKMSKRNFPMIFGLSFMFSFIMSFNLALFIGKEGFIFGLMAGFLTGFGWVSLSLAIISLFESRSWKYILINGGYMVISFTVMGGIIGIWK